ncbi:DUF1015 domain-containing protein [Mucilaginibacter sp. 14171R-50]|uniref:DUF1015 family protein n=1 Tax=Mucilaginibacter sp. 14171R-50 TaxID=2703789 RepID=UPI00138D3BAE|nr:DUF1015 family protein [Mucilaginibacter sp. 14171R-50]QHS57533.1 DUF1015 domain-containing protein [Mucilaginibacter sp. 14171R-50]
MASISPFCAIRPNPFYADQLVFPGADPIVVLDHGKPEEKLLPLKQTLEAGARVRPEIPGNQQKAFENIRFNLEQQLSQGKLWQEQQPAIYVYEVITRSYRQTGIWALTHLDDYRNNHILTHEHTFNDNVRRQKIYRGNTGIEGSPVLLTYTPNRVINRIIADVRKQDHDILMGDKDWLHKLWKIEDETLIAQLTAAFAQITPVYLSDGHHRLESALQLADEQREQGVKPFDCISSLYMCTDQLRIEEYNRVVIPDEHIPTGELLKKIEADFYITESPENAPVKPKDKHSVGMLVNGRWFILQARVHTYQHVTGANALDAAILQRVVFKPIFGIIDPKTDSRLKCAGGEGSIKDILTIVQHYPHAIAFMLGPLSVTELMNVADAREVLPPKSTWIVPKVPYGLLINRHIG